MGRRIQSMLRGRRPIFRALAAGALLSGAGTVTTAALALSSAPAGALACSPAGSTGLTAAQIVTTNLTGPTTIDATGCDVGIYVPPGTSGITIDNVTVNNANDHGIFVQDSDSITISHSTFQNNGLNPNSSIQENKAVELVGTSNSTVTQNTVTGNLADGGIGVADDGPINPGAPNAGTLHAATNDTVTNNVSSQNFSGCGVVFAAYNAGGGVSGGSIDHNTVAGTIGQFGPHGPVIGGVVVAADAPNSTVSGVSVTANTITQAGIPGVIVHSNAPKDAVSNISITGNTFDHDDWLATDGPPVPGAVIVAASPIPGPSAPTVTGTIVTGNTITNEFYGIWLAGATSTTSTPNTVTTTPGGQAVFTVPNPGSGYWQVSSDGGIFNFGSAGYYGSMGGIKLNKPVVGISQTLDQGGYWMAASDGGIFSFGDAVFMGSMGGTPLNQPVVGIAATPVNQNTPPPAPPTPGGKGYWEVASDGGIFSFGDAGFFGSMGAKPLNKPVVGIAPTPDGNGYWEVASDGGIFAFGDAGFFGSMGGKPLNKPIVGMTASPSGNGYLMVASDGGIFAFGDAAFNGSMGGKPLVAPVVGLAGVGVTTTA